MRQIDHAPRGGAPEIAVATNGGKSAPTADAALDLTSRAEVSLARVPNLRCRVSPGRSDRGPESGSCRITSSQWRLARAERGLVVAGIDVRAIVSLEDGHLQHPAPIDVLPVGIPVPADPDGDVGVVEHVPTAVLDEHRPGLDQATEDLHEEWAVMAPE
jgi:hypothetical protein